MISLKNVSKSIDNKKIIDNISLEIPDGSSFALIGSNGAGKSTLLRLISGIYGQNNGEILLDNEKIYDNPSVKEKIFFINDETVQFTGFTLKSLKDYYKSFYSDFSEEIFENLRQRINLPLEKKIGDFSKGMKRQAIVIIGLACRTEYLLMDEAFDGLDPTMRIIIKQMLIDAMIDRQLTTIISSHNLKEINEVCDTACLIHHGKLVFSRDLDSLKSNIHKVQLVFPPDSNGMARVYTKQQLEESGLEILHYEQRQSVCYVIAKGDTDTIKSAFASKSPIVMDIIPLTLEEIFIYGEELR